MACLQLIYHCNQIILPNKCFILSLTTFPYYSCIVTVIFFPLLKIISSSSKICLCLYFRCDNIKGCILDSNAVTTEAGTCIMNGERYQYKADATITKYKLLVHRTKINFARQSQQRKN